jgi:hypothetical protein
LIQQSLSDCDEPLTDRFPHGMRSGSPKFDTAGNAGHASVGGSLDGIFDTAVQHSVIDIR